MFKYIIGIVLLSSCTYLNKDRGVSKDLIQLKKNYYSYLDDTCVEDKYYDGLRNTFQYGACLLDEKVLNDQLNINRMALIWSDKEYYRQRSELDKAMSKESIVFLSFYSPSIKLVDLEKKSTGWKVYLNDGEKRYESISIIKMANKYEEIKNLYPIHTHWGTAYRVKFPVAINMINRSDLKLTITSREGYSQKEIPIGNLD